MDIKTLLHYWHVEIIGINKNFSFLRLFTRMRNKPGLKFIFWWRLANYLYQNGYKRLAFRIHNKLKARFSCDIMPGAQIGEGLSIAHHVGIVISKRVIAGKNMKLTQNCVIGNSGRGMEGNIIIGDDFFMGSNSCIISDNLTIGNNVTLGAMSFINKNIPDNVTVYTKKENSIITK